MKNIITFIIIIITIFLSNCAVSHKPVYEKDGKRYGVTEGLFRSRWWNFYERGLSYYDGGYWEDAADDFTEAIKRRDADQRRARTYGLHLIDYFPHRDLGISYYRLGMLEDAIRELERSLAMVESSKAQYFLDNARHDFLEISGFDKFPPTISIQYPTDDHFTNAFKIKISGSASDDYFVKTITIGGKSVLINLSEKEIVFKKEVELNVGSNEIMIVAGDLMGKTTTTSINIEVDRQGPQLSIEDIRYIGDERGIVFCQGYIYDTTGIKEFYLNGSRISLNEGEEMQFDVMVELNEDEPTISFLASDFIGNTTHGLIEIWDGDAGPILSKAKDIDKSTNRIVYRIKHQIKRDEVPPVIFIKDLTEKQIVYYDTIYNELHEKLC